LPAISQHFDMLVISLNCVFIFVLAIASLKYSFLRHNSALLAVLSKLIL